MSPNIIRIDKVTDKHYTMIDAAKYTGLGYQVIRNYISMGKLTKYVFRDQLTFLHVNELNKYKYK